MEKLLHERLRDWSESGETDAWKQFYSEYKQIYSSDEYLEHSYAFGKMADEIERYYIPREDHEREIEEVIEAQGRHFPTAHHIMQVWAKSHDMEWPDGASITKFLDHYYIPRPRFDDGEPVSEESESENGHIKTWRVYADGTYELLDDDDEVIKIAGLPHPVFRPSPKVLDADGVPIKEGDTMWPIDAPDMKMTVDNFQCIYGQSVTVNCEHEGKIYNFNPDKVTHKEPDSLEKLRDDISEYVAMFDIVGSTQERYHQIWADRLTAIMERDA